MSKKLIYECEDVFECNLDVTVNSLGGVEIDCGFGFVAISKKKSIEMARAILKHYGEDNV